MKHIKDYQKFLNENYVSGNKVSGLVYHASGFPIENLKKDPMWFALEKVHSDKGWFSNLIDDGSDEAYQYQAKINGKIADLGDPAVEKLFNDIGVDPMDYETEILGNPTAKEVMSLKGTKALIKAGYDGLVYYDYDPRDFQSDLEALIVFNPAKTVKNWKLSKQYPI